MKDFMDILTQDWIGINMWKVTYQFRLAANPTMYSRTMVIEAKTKDEACEKAREHLKKHLWFNINSITQAQPG